jgi:hypothetical protein
VAEEHEHRVAHGLVVHIIVVHEPVRVLAGVDVEEKSSEQHREDDHHDHYQDENIRQGGQGD